jgi:hypothetical protein
MNIIDKIIPNKKTDEDIEEALEDKIIKEEEDNVESEYLNSDIKSTLITYIPTSEEDMSCRMEILVDEMHTPILPEPGSVIWVMKEDGLRPWKCIRYDYIENGSLYDVRRVYIVAEKATSSDIMEKPSYSED